MTFGLSGIALTASRGNAAISTRHRHRAWLALWPHSRLGAAAAREEQKGELNFFCVS